MQRLTLRTKCLADVAVVETLQALTVPREGTVAVTRLKERTLWSCRPIISI